MTNELLPILRVARNSLPSLALVCGDPERVKQIAAYLESPEEISYSREYRLMQGKYKGAPLSIASHGVGAAGAAVCFEELIKAGAKQIIRVGTAGAYHESLPPGSLLIVDSAARCEGLSHQLVPQGMPAVANFELVMALQQAAQLYASVLYATGTVVTLDAFYAGVVEFPHLQYKASGALGAEMEMAALFTIARLRGIKAAGIVALDGYAFADMNQYNPHKALVHLAIEQEIQVALEAACLLQQSS